MRRASYSRRVLSTETVNLREARRYAQRVSDRWPLSAAFLRGEPGASYLAVLVSPAFDGVPWLERVHVAESLWDATTMGAPLEAHCYTPPELERKRESLPRVRAAADTGIDLLAE